MDKKRGAKEQARAYASGLGVRHIFLSNGLLHYYWSLRQGNPVRMSRFLPLEELGKAAEWKPNAQRLASVAVDEMTIDFANNNLNGKSKWRAGEFRDYDTSRTRVCVTVGMMTTGYDCEDVLNVVLARPIFSATDFIQIKGRGTRLCTFAAHERRLSSSPRRITAAAPRRSVTVPGNLGFARALPHNPAGLARTLGILWLA